MARSVWGACLRPPLSCGLSGEPAGDSVSQPCAARGLLLGRATQPVVAQHTIETLPPAACWRCHLLVAAACKVA
jgi:hypothetical protein